jgi:hypothetical protein
MITAHGGALGTGRNSKKYFDTVCAYPIGAIEVDIRRRFGELVLGHIAAPVRKSKVITLSEVFEYCKVNNVMVNCDVKERNMVAPVLELAERLDAREFIYFTGSVKPSEIAALTGGTAYVNTHFYKRKIPLSVKNLPAIKAYLVGFNNPRLRGINIPYSYATDEFMLRAAEIDLPLSIYTVDDRAELKRLISFNPWNITTNIVDAAFDIINGSD